MTTPREQLIEAIDAIVDKERIGGYEHSDCFWKIEGEQILEAIEAEDYVLIKSKDEHGNPLIVASAEAVVQISKIAVEEFRRSFGEGES